MKKHKMPDMKEGGVNVTPLIDIVMCLIIFFMLVAKIGVSTGAESMEIPETILGGRIEDMGNTLVLNVRRGIGDEPRITALVDGKAGAEIRLSGMDPSGKPESPLVKLLSALRRNNDKFSVIVRAEKELPYRFLEPVLMAAAQSNVSNVNFNTKIVTERR
jgi:biopolymer transport protein ExbD